MTLLHTTKKGFQRLLALLFTKQLHFTVILTVACTFQHSFSVGQCTPIANAIPNITLTYVQGGGTNASGVAFNPDFNVYYAAIAGNSGFPLETFDAAGTPLYQTNTGFDMRGLWWNPNLGQLESNGYNTLGIWSYNLNASGYALNTGTSVFTGMNQPTSQSVGDYNCVDNEIIYYNNGQIMRRDRTTNALIGNLNVTGLPVATSNLNNNSVFYTDCAGHEIGLLDYVNKAIYFVDKTTGAYSGMSQLPPGTVTNVSFRASWANDMVWLYNTADRTWYSFEVLTGFGGTCSSPVVCTPPNLITDDLTGCSPNSVDLNSGINAASDPGNASFYSNSADANAGTNAISNTVSASGTYYVRYEDPSDPSCYTEGTILVTINPDYSISENVNACENSTVTYPDGFSEVITASTSHISNLTTVAGCDSVITTNVTMDPEYSITENINACENSTVTYPDGFSEVITANTSHTSNLTTVAGCDSVITTNVTMDPVYSSSENVTICSGSDYTYPDGTTSTNVTANESHTSTLSSAQGCDSVVTTNLTVDPLPDAGTNGTMDFCPADPPSDLFSALSGSPDAGGTWSPAMASGSGIFDPSADAPGTYTYSVTNPCGTSSADVVVTIQSTPDPGTNGTTTFCSSDASADLFTFLGGTPDAGGTWSPALTSGSGIFDPAVDPAGVYTYEFTSICGTYNAQVDVTVNTADDATFSYPSSAFCINDADPIATVSGTSGGTFTISGSGTIDPSTGTIDLSATGPGTFSVTYTTSGVCPDVSTLSITIANTADPTILSSSSSLCEYDSPINLQAASSGGTWSGPGVDAATGIFDPSQANTGFNTITYTIPGPCGGSNSIQIEVTATPTVSTIPDTTINSGETIVLTTIGGAGNYTWSPSTWLNCNDCQNPSATPEDTIIYMVTLEDNGCTASDYVVVNVLYEPSVFVPNIFSPNGDNMNDVLYVRGKGIETVHFVVYDRWGEKVFESDDINYGWDGYFRGKKMNPAVFVYYAEVNFRDGTSTVVKGDVTLTR